MTPDAIEALALRALTQAGATPHQAAPVARSVRRAEEDGIGPVGLGYLPTYLAHLRSGKVRGDARPVVERPRPGVVQVDAAHGFAHPAFDTGLAALVAAARANGVAAMAIARSYSIGVLGHPVEDIAGRGLVALAMTNSPPNMAVWGGRRKQFGTNPIAFAIPRDPAPIVVDMATTVVTKVALAARAAAEEPIPPDWALDAEGRPTTDARAAMGGAMLPFGGAKGANVALLVELFAAVLTGAALSREVQPYAVAEGPPPGVGQFFLACDPAAFAPGFADRLATLAAAITEEAGVRLPGDRRLAARAAAAAQGIAVPPDLLARIEALA
ncbi:Ldh family oxidoreductase [Falsiroseomonas sp. HW251]|uniref:Ldh family oxidoreductase n=1 Tax=Falsiroseomonas sp. HW251 TaxID=3390998 RepID=UPI003D317079